jgi:hypothetical protein
MAYDRCDYETAIGRLNFAPGEESKTIVILLWDDAHVEGAETFNITLNSPNGTALGSLSVTTVTINDNDATPSNSNPIERRRVFREDAISRLPLSRTARAGGWLRVLRNCPNKNNDPGCYRVTVSSSFFRSQEFHIKGYYVFRFYRVSFGRAPSYREFIRDLRRVTGQTAQEVTTAQAEYAVEFNNRQDFRTRYDTKSNDQYVDELQASVEVRVSNSQGLKDDLNANRKTRAEVLREIVESQEVAAKEFNRGFVAAEYFGYLRRDPEEGGFNPWLNHLNNNPGDFRRMVRGFLDSVEYRPRFGRP